MPPVSPVSPKLTRTASMRMDSDITGFDEQFFQPELYRLDEAHEAEHLLPYHTIVNIDNGELRIPGPLSFVQSNWFFMLTGALVAVNITVDYLKVSGRAGLSISDKTLHDLSDLCLIFYVCEVALRLLHFRKWFFVHRLDAKWNFFDVLIVSSGVADHWVVPLFVPQHSKISAGWVPFLRSLRCLRLLRLIKLFGVLMRSDFRWTNSVWFNSLVSIIIVFSIIIMGLETDINSSLWEPLDSIVLGFFFFEVFVRLRRQGLQFFYEESCLWNILDLFIVVFGVFDQWILNLWMALVRGQQRSSELGDILLLIRMLRLLRILRLLRLVKAVRPLYLLALGVIEAMQSMFWVLVLTLVTLYTVAILMTRMVGHGALLENDSEIPEVTRSLFENVPASMFTLFVLMNGEEWRKVEPLLSRYAGMKMVFVVFTIFSSWALLSVMTGVVSDNMISAKKSQNQKDEMMHGERGQRITKVMDDFFLAADDKGSGSIDSDRYNEMLDMPFYARKLQLAAPNASLKDLRDLFSWLDSDSIDKVTKEEFVRGFGTLTEPLTGKALLSVDADVKHRFAEFQDQVKTDASSLAELRQEAAEWHRKVLAAIDEPSGLPPRQASNGTSSVGAAAASAPS